MIWTTTKDKDIENICLQNTINCLEKDSLILLGARFGVGKSTLTNKNK